jgi:IS1 family transposase
VCLSAQAYIGSMNQLSLEQRAAVVRSLVEGNSIRATCRLTGTAKNTVTRLLVDLGDVCGVYQDHKLRNLQCKRIQCDEIWAFVGAKQKHVEGGAKGHGDVWTWTAIDPDSKLMVCWLVGQRGHRSARAFMEDLELRLARRVQLTTDGFRAYEDAVDLAFGANVDYAMLVKTYAHVIEHQVRYSPPICTGSAKIPMWGEPDPDYISTSHVERANLSMRMGMRRFTRLTNGFSRKVENHAHAVSLHFMYYNFCRPHTTLTKAHPRHYLTTPAMAAGVADHPWAVEDVCSLLDPRRELT